VLSSTVWFEAMDQKAQWLNRLHKHRTGKSGKSRKAGLERPALLPKTRVLTRRL